VTLKLAGTSMLPAIWPGDMVRFQHCQPADLRKGEIILYRLDGVLTAHRLVRIEDDQIVVRGDTRTCCDPPVSADKVVGRATAVCRKGQFVPLSYSVGQRAISLLLRRSRLCIRLLLRFESSKWWTRA
jgi:hypothetical protein